jgi:hypothetical protein
MQGHQTASDRVLAFTGFEWTVRYAQARGSLARRGAGRRFASSGYRAHSQPSSRAQASPYHQRAHSHLPDGVHGRIRIVVPLVLDRHHGPNRTLLVDVGLSATAD